VILGAAKNLVVSICFETLRFTQGDSLGLLKQALSEYREYTLRGSDRQTMKGHVQTAGIMLR
ncbi:MAG: hypothetical protein NTX06_12960, partial [Proteobacteria bacterium]|nr:hypothetical protein [Pseudomonadota bacterium]